MIAQIRVAARREAPGFFRPLVCVAGGEIVFLFHSWRSEVSAPDGTVILSSDIGAFSINVEYRANGLYIDGQRVAQEWPSPYQRIIRAARWTFRVKPEDDTLLFEYEGRRPSLDAAVVGFYCYLNSVAGDGGI